MIPNLFRSRGRSNLRFVTKIMEENYLFHSKKTVPIEKSTIQGQNF